MGANTYLKDVDSYGYKAAAATGTALVQNITGKSGKRIAIRAFGFTDSDVATSLYFMQVMGTTTIKAAVASGQGSVTLTSTAIGGSVTGTVGTLAADDYCVYLLDNGDYFFDLVASVAGSLVTLTNVLTDTIAAGQTVWGFGAAGDAGQVEYALTASSQNTEALDGGIFYAGAKAYPMMVYYLNAAATGLGSIDYITVDYINV